MKKYVKEFEGGKLVYKMLDGFGRPCREVETTEWEIGDYIGSCLYPLSNCIDRMRQAAEDASDSPMGEYVAILDRLYDAAMTEIEKMDEIIYKSMGWVQILKTSENCRGGFMQQDLLDAYVKKESNEKAVNA